YQSRHSGLMVAGIPSRGTPMGAIYLRPWLWLVALLVAAKLVVLRPSRAAPGPSNDPRALSTLIQPGSGLCLQDVSDDGHLLFVACSTSVENKDGQDLTKLFVYDIADLHSPHEISETALGSIGVT